MDVMTYLRLMIVQYRSLNGVISRPNDQAAKNEADLKRRLDVTSSKLARIFVQDSSST